MEFVVLGVLLFVAAVIAVDTVRQRRMRARASTSGRPRRSAGRARAFPAALATALAREANVDVYRVIGDTLEVAGLRPDCRTERRSGSRLRWGNDYAMIARADRELHYRLEVWEAELLPRMDGTRTVGDLIVERMDTGVSSTPRASPISSWPCTGRFPRCAPIPTDELVADRLDASSPGRKKLKRFGKTLSIEWKGRSARPVLLPEPAPTVLLVARRRGVGPRRARRAGCLRRRDPSGDFSLNHRSAPSKERSRGLAFFLTFMHELGHSVVIALRPQGEERRLPDHFGAPAFFVEADSLMLDRRQRIVQASRAVHGARDRGIASLVIFAFPEGRATSSTSSRSSTTSFAMNLVPLLELDGYWILSDLIQVLISAPAPSSSSSTTSGTRPERASACPAGVGPRRVRHRRIAFDLLVLDRVLLLEDRSSAWWSSGTEVSGRGSLLSSPPSSRAGRAGPLEPREGDLAPDPGVGPLAPVQARDVVARGSRGADRRAACVRRPA